MSASQFDLRDKVAVISGCNTGLGQGMALALAEAGCHILGVNYSEPEDTKAQVESLDRGFVNIHADLRKTDAIKEIVETAVNHFGQIDILVNNAGIIKRNDAYDFTEAEWDDVLNINLRTLFFMAQAVARQYRKQGNGGKIINVASMLSYQGGVRVPSYTASKSGVMGLTRALANEWAADGINVNAIAPGYMATNNTEQLRNDPERSQELLGRIPAGRWGTPNDMKGPIVFLASQASDYVNGFTLAVDGGWLAR